MEKERLPGTWVLEAFQRGGVDIEVLTQCMPNEVNAVLFQTNTIELDSLNGLLIKCAELSNNQNFGLTLNEWIDASMYGVLGYLLLNSSTVEDFLGYIQRYYKILYSTGAFFKISVEDEMLDIQYSGSILGQIDARHQTEWTLGFIPYHLKPLLGDASKPISAHFTHSAPNNLQRLKSVFGLDLHFNQLENKLVYHKSILKRSLSYASPSLLKILCQEADELLQSCLDHDALDKRVRLLLLENLALHKANASDIATEMNMTLSTFKRRLAQENINFLEMKKSVKNELAKKLLLSSEASMFEIARKIGFSDQSSFSRFFTRCNKITPQRFRDKNRRSH